MSFETLYYLYATAVGFTAAALIGTLFATLLNRQLDFRFAYERPLQAFMAVFLCLTAGPYILYSATTNAHREGRIPATFLLTGLSLSILWSLCGGILVIQIAYVLSGGII